MDEVKRILETKVRRLFMQRLGCRRTAQQTQRNDTPTLQANSPFKVCEALKETLQDWVLDYGSDPSFSRVYSTYNKLKVCRANCSCST